MSRTVARLRLAGIRKAYPAVVANDGIDLDVLPGEIHAVLGENGAGKSTLMKIIYGVVKPDAGEIRWNGERVEIANPAHARRLSIGMVFQHFSLFETLTVAENIALAVEDSKDLRALAQRIEEVSERYGLPLDPRRLVHSLSVGERQRVEIVRCLLQQPQLLIMDEPTSVLTPQAVERLFETLRQLAAEGCSILYISHKLDEIQRLCQRATVLRAGRVTGTCDPRTETASTLARMMIGREPPAATHPPARTDGEERLVIAGLSLASDDPFGTALKDIDLRVRSGEIVGIAGVSGNGQKELLAALSGERRVNAAGMIRILSVDAGRLSPGARRKRGFCFVPEERLGRGAVPSLSLAENALLTAHRRGMVKAGLVIDGAVRAFARTCIERFDVRTGGADSAARSLSGGNLQKYIVGREILQEPKVLVVAQPTWGVDVGAAAFIRQSIVDLRNAGAAVLVVSEELDELFEVCDRIAVIAQGRLSPAVPARETNVEEIGRWMSGLWGDRAAARAGDVEAALPFRLEARPAPSRRMRWLSPLIAAALTLVAGLFLFLALGQNPLAAFHAFFVAPLSSTNGVAEWLLKASPLMLIATGLAVGFRAGVWNIGAEGQLALGAIAATGLALAFDSGERPWLLPAMVVAGAAGGMAWAAIPALLRTRFNANEILTSLMLTYVAAYLLSWLVHEPWRDPEGYNFPQSKLFESTALFEPLFEGLRLNASLFIALGGVAAGWVLMNRSFAGYQMRVAGLAPDAARYAGFSASRTVWIGMLAGGAAAGIAGVGEVAGPLGQLLPTVSPGYGFAAIIVAFVGRLNAFGIVLASLLMSLLYLGGESAQIALGLPAAITGLFQGMLLFFLLGADVFIQYRLRRTPALLRAA